MPTVRFTPILQRHLQVQPETVDGSTVRAVLAGVFERNPRLRSYVLEDHGGLRKHVVVFVDGQQVEDRLDLGDAVPEGAEVYVMQALSGG